jgi:AcrR family transcriptional regulator
VDSVQGVDPSTRDRLLDAAAQVFCERGYEGTTVSMVARQAGLTTGAIYANFRDKAELLLQTIERGSQQAVADMEVARKAGVSAANRLLLMARRMVTDPDPMQQQLFVEMFAAARRDADVGIRVADALAAMEHEVDRAQADGDVGPEWDVAVLARFCMALGVGFTHLKTAGLSDPDTTNWIALTGRLVSSLAPSQPTQ